MICKQVPKFSGILPHTMASISIDSKALVGPYIATRMTLSKVLVIMQFRCFCLQFCTEKALSHVAVLTR
jgi:hypothetical protein